MTDKHTPDEIQKEFDAAVKNFQAQEKLRDAAPDLLKALEIAVNRLVFTNTETDGGENDNRFHIDLARKAINKATQTT